MKIAFFSTKSYDKEFFDAANKAFGFEINYIDARLTSETAALARGHNAICVFVNNQITQEIINRLCREGVGLIALRSAGYNHIDLQAAYQKIRIVRVPRYSPYSVAEHAVGLMLCLNRKIHLAHARVTKGNFSIAGLMGFDMHGKTAGVIGCGHIGSAVAAILKGFGIKVLGYDIDKSQVEKSGCIYADLSTLYKESDIITLHTALTPENHHMINQGVIAQMKTGVMIINTGRGGLIDTKALIEALGSKKVGVAGLDVYENESPFFYEDCSSSGMKDDVLKTLLALPNVLITSHQAFFTKEAMQNIAYTTLENIKAYADGSPLHNEVCFCSA